MASQSSKTVQSAGLTWAQRVSNPEAAAVHDKTVLQEKDSRREAARQEHDRQEKADLKKKSRQKVADHREALQQKDLQQLAAHQKALQQEKLPLVASCQQNARQEDLQEELCTVASCQQTLQEQKERRQQDIFQKGVQLRADSFGEDHLSEEVLYKEAMDEEYRRRKNDSTNRTFHSVSWSRELNS